MREGERKKLIEVLKEEFGAEKAVEVLDKLGGEERSLAAQCFLINTWDVGSDDVKAISKENWEFLVNFLDEHCPDFDLETETESVRDDEFEDVRV